jgi:hypothetical protein
VVQLDAFPPQQDVQPPIAEPPPLKSSASSFSRARTAASSGRRDA